MRALSLLPGLWLAGCAGAPELACRLEADAAGQLARPIFQSTLCIGFPCTPPMLAGAPVWNPASEQAYQRCLATGVLAAAMPAARRGVG